MSGISGLVVGDGRVQDALVDGFAELPLLVGESVLVERFRVGGADGGVGGSGVGDIYWQRKRGRNFLCAVEPKTAGVDFGEPSGVVSEELGDGLVGDIMPIQTVPSGLVRMLSLVVTASCPASAKKLRRVGFFCVTGFLSRGATRTDCQLTPSVER